MPLCLPPFAAFVFVSSVVAPAGKPPPLVEAVWRDDVSQARALLQSRGAQAEERDAQRNLTPLMWAASGGQVAMIELLLSSGADVQAIDGIGQTPLFFAISLPLRPERHPTLAETTAVIRALVKAGANIEAPLRPVGGLPGGITPLRTVTAGNIELMKVLIEAGANVNAMDSRGNTPLMAAVDERWGENSDAQALAKAKLLLDHGALIDASVNSLTPIMVALWSGFPETAKLLVSRGASLKGKSNNGTTMLMFAAHCGDPDLVRQLLAEGADTKATNAAGDTALLMALGDRPNRPAPPPGLRTVVDTLLAHGAEVAVRTNKGQTPLMLAARLGDAALFNLFLGRGGDVHAVDQLRSTLLMHAAAGGNASIVKQLLEEGLSPRVADGDGDTALNWAAARARASIINLLLVAGADINTRNVAGQTPLLLAIDCANKASPPVVRSLIERGADPKGALERAHACQGSEMTRAVEEGTSRAAKR